MTIIPSRLLSEKRKLPTDDSRQKKNKTMFVERLLGCLVPYWNAAFTLVPCCLQILQLLDSQRGYLVVLKAPGLIQSISYYFCRLFVWFCVSGAVTFSLLVLSTLFTFFFPQFFYKKKNLKNVLTIRKRRKASHDQTVIIAPFFILLLLMSLPSNNIQSDKKPEFSLFHVAARCHNNWCSSGL